MPHPQLDPEEAKRKRQQRNQRYRANPATKERNKEHDKLYRQNKRHRARQTSPQDPLNQLMDIVGQQQYLETENDTMDEGMMIESVGEEEGIIDANNMMEEDGENFRDDHWNEGFPDEIGSEMNDNDVGDWNEGFPDEIDSDMNDDGDDEPDGGFDDDSVDSDMNDDGSQIVIYY
jgi:hypothetical protein